jgi:hypothetical protein
MKSNYFKKPLVIAPVIIMALFLASLIGTPYLIDTGLERWIDSHGPGKGAVENIDFNPFSGRLVMDNLVVQTKSGRTLTISHAELTFSWKQLFKKHLYLKKLVLRDTFLLVDVLDDTGYRVGGLILKELIGTGNKSGEPGWEVGIGHFELQNARIQYDTPELVATYFIDKYTLEGLETWNKEKAVSMAFEGRIDESPVQVKAEVVPLGKVKRWDGTLVLEKGAIGLISNMSGMQQYDPSGTIKLDLKLDARLQEDGSISVAADGTAVLHKLQFGYQGYELQQENIFWRGRIKSNLSADEGLELKAEGKLTGDNLSLVKGADALNLKIDAIDWQGKTRFSNEADAGITFADESDLALDKMQLQLKGYGLQQEKVTWQGNITGNIKADEKLAGTAAGKLTGTELQLDDSGHSKQLKIGALNWQGKAGVAPGEEQFAITMDSVFGGGDLRVNDLQNNLLLLGLDKFDLAGVRLEGLDNITVSQVDLQTLRLAEKIGATENKTPGTLPPLVQASAVTIAAINLKSGSDLSIDTMHLNDLQSYIHRNKNSGWQIIPALLASVESIPAQPALKAEQKSGEKRPFRMDLNRLQTGGSSFIDFADKALERPFRTKFYINELTVADMSTAAGAEPADFTLKGRVGEYGTVSFAGTFKPAAETVTMDVKGTVKALDMPPFSSYSGRAIGYNVTSGQTDADVTMDIDQGKIDGQFALQMRNLEVAPVNSGAVPEIDKNLDVPLGTALAMLRDKNSEININVNLEGDIKNPEFGFQDAINQALAKAVTFASLNYLKYALQPFGTYIAIAEVIGKAGKEIAKVRLDPVAFPAGEAVLNDAATEYLKKVAGVLHNRPELEVEVCGKAVSMDKSVLLERKKDAGEEMKKEETGKETEIPPPTHEELLNLAKMRAANVKDNLVNQHDINNERLYLCLPEILEPQDEKPRVELLID